MKVVWESTTGRHNHILHFTKRWHLDVVLRGKLGESGRSMSFRRQAQISHSGCEEQVYGSDWASDQAKCNRGPGSSEALFQRTLMMSLISRHLLFYSTDPRYRGVLDFWVEGMWTCPPMPTKAYH